MEYYFFKFRLLLFQPKDQQSNHKFQSSLEAKLEEDLSNIPRRKGSIDVHIVESQTKSTTEATTVKTEGKSACTMKYSVSRNNLYEFQVLCGVFTDTLKIWKL
jgi:hypothetical protein